MTITRNRTRLERVEVMAPAPRRRVDELEELIIAVEDRLEVLADPDRRARLQRGRAALELELAGALEL